MKIISYLHGGKPTFGFVMGNAVIDAGRIVADRYASLRAVLAADALQTVAEACLDTTPDTAIDDVTFLPVIPGPAKIFCVGLNYEAHREETGRDSLPHPTIFTRFADTLVGHGQPIVRPEASGLLDYEGEMAVIIGKGGRHIARGDAMDHVAGYSCFNDGSVRDWQNHSSQFTAGKNFPATGGFGPWLVTQDEVGDPHALDIETRLNGETMQASNTDKLIFDIPTLIEYLSTFTPLAPGDVIATGTPSGVGFKRKPPVYMQPGDEAIVEIEKVGILRNPIVAEETAS
jgi:2-keto-4-pentenoate hydratase/2-oxohepta-3-ene-1,7-dioic acid hydratase in catechol pathway